MAELAPALDHLFNHQTHHRGQCHAILTGLGTEAPGLDLMGFYNEVGHGGLIRLGLIACRGPPAPLFTAAPRRPSSRRVRSMAEPQRRTDAEPHVAADDHFLIVEGRFYDDIGERLLAGAKAALDAAGASYDVVTMPGALEVPPAIAIAADDAASAGRSYGGAVALGCILRGETYHFEVVSNESARGLMALALERRMPIGNGILTVEDADQALARAEPSRGDKGGEAARAMLALWRLKTRPAVPAAAAAGSAP